VKTFKVLHLPFLGYLRT